MRILLKKRFRYLLQASFVVMSLNIFGGHTYSEFDIYSSSATTQFNLGRLCFVDASKNRPKINIFLPDKSELARVVCKQNLRELIPYKIRYHNWRKKKLSTVEIERGKLQKIEGAESFILLWEYKNRMPFWFHLKCLHDLKELVAYLKKLFTTFNVTEQFANNLLITVEKYDDELAPFYLQRSLAQPSSEILDQEEKDFLSKYFKLATTEVEIVTFTANKALLDKKIKFIDKEMDQDRSSIKSLFLDLWNGITPSGFVAFTMVYFLIDLIGRKQR